MRKLNDLSRMMQVTRAPTDARNVSLHDHCSRLYTPFKEPNKIKVRKYDTLDNSQKDLITGIDKQMWPSICFCFLKKPVIFYILFNVGSSLGFSPLL